MLHIKKMSKPLYFRCDQSTDCHDVSDEKNCQIVIIDENNYLKDKPPKQGIVKVRVELLKILEIGEVAMLFSSQYALQLEWLDGRITYYNLHGNQSLNTLVEEEKQMIWTPSFIFDNTKSKTRTTTDKESIISVRRMGNFSRNTIESIDNVYIFRGRENPLDMARIYQTDWICDYLMNWYPFDTQKCSLTFALTDELNNFIKIIPNGHEYLGPVELTQYFVRDTKMISERVGKKNIQAIVYEVRLGQRLLGNLLTIFLPTILLNVIGRNYKQWSYN